MSELGQWLRETRQAKELSLEQAEAETRIRAKFLAALEKEDYDELPGGIYTKGLLRNYALFLGLDPEKVLEKYEKRDTGRSDGEPRLFRPLEVILVRATAKRLRGRLLLLALIASLLTAGLWAWRTGRLAWPPPPALFQPTATASPTVSPSATLEAEDTVELPTRSARPTSTATATAQAPVTHTPNPTPTAGVLVGPTPTFSPTPTVSPTKLPTATLEPTKESAAESPTPSPTSMPDSGVTLSITITETNWVEVTVDSRNVFRELMEAGEQGTWEARREIILRLGNAGGAKVTVNGEFLGTLGERQQVIEFAWGPEGKVTPQPTATATPTPETTTDIRELPIP